MIVRRDPSLAPHGAARAPLRRRRTLKGRSRFPCAASPAHGLGPPSRRSRRGTHARNRGRIEAAGAVYRPKGSCVPRMPGRTGARRIVFSILPSPTRRRGHVEAVAAGRRRGRASLPGRPPEGSCAVLCAQGFVQYNSRGAEAAPDHPENPSKRRPGRSRRTSRRRHRAPVPCCARWRSSHEPCFVALVLDESNADRSGGVPWQQG